MGPETAAFDRFLCGWRDDLRRVLEMDPEGYIGRGHAVLANSITSSFPSIDVLQQYAQQITTFSDHSMDNASTQITFNHDICSCQPSLGTLALFCVSKFGWDGNKVVEKMCTTVVEGTRLRMLCGVGKNVN